MSLILLFLSLLSLACSWRPLLIGHRGGSDQLENSLEAYRSGIDDYGYDGIHGELKVTKDDQYVLSADESLGTDKGARMSIGETELAKLKEGTITKRKHGQERSGTICTLEEMLRLCKEKQVIPVIELKWTKGITAVDMNNFKGVAELVEKYGLEDKVVFLSTLKPSLEHIKTHYPKFKCQYLTYLMNQAKFNWIEKNKMNPSIKHGAVNNDDVKKVRDNGMDVAVWGVNNEDDYMKYAKMGIYMLTVDKLKKSNLPQVEYLSWKQNPDL